MGTTSLLALQRLGSLGNIASGGGAPTGQPITAANLAALQAITADEGAIGFTLDTFTIYQWESGDWSFFRGTFATFAALPTAPIVFGAVCSVGSGDVEAATQYVWDGSAWERAPDLTGYIWPAVATAGELPTAAMGAESGDRCTVSATGFVHQFNGTIWQDIYGTVATTASLPSSAINSAALFGVGSDGVHERTWYGRSGGNWVRTPENVPYGRVLSSLQDVLSTDVVGDFGAYTNPTSGAVDTYRLRSVAIASAIGGGTLLTWVPSAIYSEASLTIRGFLVGTETMPARGSAIQGYTVLGSGTGSVTGVAGEIVLTSTASGTFAGLQSTYVLQPTDKVYIRQNSRVTQTAAVNVTYFHLLYSGGTTQPQWVVTQNPTFSSGALVPSTTSSVLVGSTLMIDPLTALSATPAELVEITARSQTGAVMLRRNNQLAFSIRRNAQTGTATGQHLMQVASGATGTCTNQISQHLFMTY
jgi:hypothetical protein